MISGKLKNDSPGTIRLLEQNLSPEQIITVMEAYSECCQAPSIQQEIELRPEGQSFNPRPARILQLLIQDAKVLCPDTMCSALLTTDAEFSSEPLVVQAVMLLDDIRHFKLYSLSTDVLLDSYTRLAAKTGFEELDLNLRKKLESGQRLYLKS